MSSLKKLFLPLMILVVAGLVVFTFIGTGKDNAYVNKLKLGLDIEGGVAVVYEGIQGDHSESEFFNLVDQTKSVLARRVNSFGLTEPNITKQGNTRIRIELPGEKDVEKALESIGKTAVLEFYLMDKDAYTKEGEVVGEDFKGEVLFKGDLLKNAELGFDENKKPAVSLELTEEARKRFAEASKKIVDTYSNGTGQIAIVLDNDVISAPLVDDYLNTKNLIIKGKFTSDEAIMLSSLIKGGALPLELKEVQTSFVNATLGRTALEKSVKAGLIGFVFIVIIMLFRYKFAGIVASISLILYACMLFIAMVLLKATLTLPGIAGLVLSIGMAVDANVIIFERLNEELSNGKSLLSSIKLSFKKAMSTIVDSNITTIIAALILFNFGEGPIKGFAVTLMIGIALSMFTAVLITRNLMLSSVEYKPLKNKNLYRYKKEVQNATN